MSNIEDLTKQTKQQKDCERWKKAQQNLEDFNEMMRLIEPYFPLPLQLTSNTLPYTTNSSTNYLP